jgi:hypothetical protein
MVRQRDFWLSQPRCPSRSACCLWQVQLPKDRRIAPSTHSRAISRLLEGGTQSATLFSVFANGGALTYNRQPLVAAKGIEQETYQSLLHENQSNLKSAAVISDLLVIIFYTLPIQSSADSDSDGEPVSLFLTKRMKSDKQTCRGPRRETLSIEAWPTSFNATRESVPICRKFCHGE